MSRYFELMQASEADPASQARRRRESADPFDTRLPVTEGRFALAASSRPRARLPQWSLRLLAEACFRRRRSFLAIAGVTMLLTILAIQIMPRHYQATMQMMVLGGDAPTQAELLRSRDVLSLALDQLRMPAAPALARDQAIDALGRTLHVALSPGSNLLTVSYRDSSPEKAKEVLQAIASAFVSRQLAVLHPERRPLWDELVDRRQRELTAAQQAVAAFLQTADIDVESAQFDRLQAGAADAQRNLDLAMQTRDQAVVEDRLDQERIRSAAFAAKPSASSIPVQPRPLLSLASGLCLALLLALGFCVFAELTRNTVCSPAELEALTGVSTFATVPLRRAQR